MTDTDSRLPPGPRLIEAYYLATPLFFLVDVFLSFPIRVSALADPGLRYLYYAFALGCGVASRVRPKVGPYVGLAESSLNILLLILSVMLPIAQLPDRVFAGESHHSRHPSRASPWPISCSPGAFWWPASTSTRRGSSRAGIPDEKVH